MVIRNWRDQPPTVGHNSALIWSLLQSKDGQRAASQEMACLQAMRGVTKHALQGRKTSDYHSHEDMEQVYYILSGNGTVLIDDERHPVREGDVVYLPPQTRHQLINDGEDWIEHLIISCRVR